MIFLDWDENKNQKNQVKHGISFEEAKTVFWDDNAIMFDDVAHSEEEDRFLLLGMSEDSIIRIISARKATKKEEERYVRGI